MGLERRAGHHWGQQLKGVPEVVSGLKRLHRRVWYLLRCGPLRAFGLPAGNWARPNAWEPGCAA